MIRNAAGEALGDLLHQFGRGAADQQITRGSLPVREDAEQWKEFRLALHLVDHDRAGQGLQRGLRFVEPGQVPRVFEVKEMLGLQ